MLALQLDGPSTCSAWLAQTLQPHLPSWPSKLKVAARNGVALSACSKGQIQSRGTVRRRGVPRLLLFTGSMSARMALMQTYSGYRGPSVQPNPSFKPSPNSVARQPSSAGPAAHFALPSGAPHCWCRLNSNVRPHNKTPTSSHPRASGHRHVKASLRRPQTLGRASYLLLCEWLWRDELGKLGGSHEEHRPARAALTSVGVRGKQCWQAAAGERLVGAACGHPTDRARRLAVPGSVAEHSSPPSSGFGCVSSVRHTCAHPVRPNPSLKLRANGMPRRPGRRYAVHCRHPGPGAPPSVPA